MEIEMFMTFCSGILALLLLANSNESSMVAKAEPQHGVNTTHVQKRLHTGASEVKTNPSDIQASTSTVKGSGSTSKCSNENCGNGTEKELGLKGGIGSRLLSGTKLGMFGGLWKQVDYEFPQYSNSGHRRNDSVLGFTKMDDNREKANNARDDSSVLKFGNGYVTSNKDIITKEFGSVNQGWGVSDRWTTNGRPTGAQVLRDANQSKYIAKGTKDIMYGTVKIAGKASSRYINTTVSNDGSIRNQLHNQDTKFIPEVGEVKYGDVKVVDSMSHRNVIKRPGHVENIISNQKGTVELNNYFSSTWVVSMKELQEITSAINTGYVKRLSRSLRFLLKQIILFVSSNYNSTTENTINWNNTVKQSDDVFKDKGFNAIFSLMRKTIVSANASEDSENENRGTGNKNIKKNMFVVYTEWRNRLSVTLLALLKSITLRSGKTKHFTKFENVTEEFGKARTDWKSLHLIRIQNIWASVISQAIETILQKELSKINHPSAAGNKSRICKKSKRIKSENNTITANRGSISDTSTNSP